MSKPYTTTFTAEEVADIFDALKSGLFYASQFDGSSGDREKADQIAATLLLVGNKQPEGGYESDAERNAAGLKKFAAECEIHGSN